MIDLLESEVIWWIELKKKWFELCKLIKDLESDVFTYFSWDVYDLKRDGFSDEDIRNFKKNVYTRNVWYFIEYNKQDQFALKIQNIILGMESYLQKFLKK